MAVAWSSCCGVAIRYVVPVLWMTPRLAVVDRMAGVAIPVRSLMSMNALLSNVFDVVVDDHRRALCR